MATFTIRKKEYEVDVLPFARLRRIWPHVKHQMNNAPKPDASQDDMIEFGFQAVDTTAKMLSLLLQPDHAELTEEYISENILTEEIEPASNQITELLYESGLLQRGPRKPSAGNDQSPSTATSTQSSQSSSSTDAKEATGTN